VKVFEEDATLLPFIELLLSVKVLEELGTLSTFIELLLSVKVFEEVGTLSTFITVPELVQLETTVSSSFPS